MMLYKSDELSRVFKKRKVLALQHLAIEHGKIHTLTGANGAGKTTLLNLLAFLDKPSTGQLYFNGRAVQYSRKSLLALRRRVVLVDQYPILFTGPVWKNIEFGLKVRGVSRQLRRKRCQEMSELVGMREFLQADAHKLSGGENKRIALARALAIEPEVLLCDEPTANVDAENQEIILRTLKRINEEKQTSIILATHYLSQGRRLAHHSLVLEHGRLSKQLKENTYRCQWAIREDGVCVCTLHEQVHLRLPYTQFKDIKDPCTIHLDPVQIQLLGQTEKISKQENTLTGSILNITQDNSRIRLFMDCGIPLHIILSKKEYLHLQPLVGSQRTVVLPEKSIIPSLQ